MKNNFKKKFKKLIIAFMVFSFGTCTYAATIAGQEMRTQVLYLAGIIDDDNSMNDMVTRDTFAKMIVKASPYKDSVSENEGVTAFSDVPNSNPYASYIKIATREGYISSFLGGYYKPNDFITYKDLIRACLSLLGYKNEDFSGSQIQGRYQTFTSLNMNENIDRNLNDFVTKIDVVNAIYNTLKTNKKEGNSIYGPTVFNKMTINNDGELNAMGLMKTKMEGPFILKRGEAINLAVPFPLDEANIFINGQSSNVSELAREVSNNGFLVYYYNKTTKTIYVYKEGTTLESTTMVKKGYVNHIYYSASDTVTPNRVEIDLAQYALGNSEVKFAFAYTGTLHVGDQVVIIYTKNNASSENDEGGVVTTGTITYACLYDTRY